MRFSLFDKFGALNSPPVFSAFARGLDRHGIGQSCHDLSADVAVIWSVVWAGRMRKNNAVWHHFRDSAKPVVVLEVGMLQRGATWKIGINGTGLSSKFCGQIDSDRPAKLMIKPKPWRHTGDTILVCTQREDSQQWAGQMPMRSWLLDVVSNVRKVSDRPITIRTHPRQPCYHIDGVNLQRPLRVPNTYDAYNFDQALERTWCVVNWNSGPGCQSIINGVPAFTGPDSLAAPVSLQDLSLIESPVTPDRDQWLAELAHTEWTLHEIESGLMIDQLLTRIKSL